MSDLRKMSDEEFSVLVTSPAPQAALQVTIRENDHVQLNSKLSRQLAKKPVQLRFNPDLSALQISLVDDDQTDRFTFSCATRKR